MEASTLVVFIQTEDEASTISALLNDSMSSDCLQTSCALYPTSVLPWISASCRIENMRTFVGNDWILTPFFDYSDIFHRVFNV